MPASSFILQPSSFRKRGFTLIEMLIVCAIITMVILLAVPAFRAMSGGRSLDAAANNVSAILSRGRAEAMGLQTTGGVLFFLDRATGKVAACVVRQVPAPTSSTAPAHVIHLDLSTSGDYVLLPQGVMLNTLDDQATSTTANDRYMGFNPVFQVNGANAASPPSGTTTRCGRAILFDSSGRLVARAYHLVIANPSSVTASTGTGNSLLGMLNGDTAGAAALTTVRVEGRTSSGTVGAGATPPAESISAVGFVLFDEQDFRGAVAGSADEQDRDGTNGNTTPTVAIPARETAEETWIDQNSTPFLVNRYNGTLIRAE